jgi:F-type H+-transporting ATPase subunit epsilon
MADQIELRIVTPERQVLREHVDEVVIPSEDGYMGVRPGHAPLLARLQVGQLSYRNGTTQHTMAVSGGYAEVQRDGVSVLAETAEMADEIDVSRAEKARDRAQARIREGSDNLDEVRAEASLRRALNRISTAGHGRGMM